MTPDQRQGAHGAPFDVSAQEQGGAGSPSTDAPEDAHSGTHLTDSGKLVAALVVSVLGSLAAKALWDRFAAPKKGRK